MLQIENEYGSYGKNNHLPLEIKKLWQATGLIEIPYYVCDGTSKSRQEIGFVDGAAVGLNGGVNDKAWSVKEKLYPHLPGLSSETYSGWFTHWGDSNFGAKTTDAYLQEIGYLLSHGHSFSMYMVHGGTNFGFTAGAGSKYDKPSHYKPIITSYDYDAPINELGQVTDKFIALKNLIQKYVHYPIPDPPAPPNPIILIDNFTPEIFASVFDLLPAPIISEEIQYMEQID